MEVLMGMNLEMEFFLIHMGTCYFNKVLDICLGNWKFMETMR